jgi:hypothetical protein
VVLSVFGSLLNGEFYENKPAFNTESNCGFKGQEFLGTEVDVAVGAGMGICIVAFILSMVQAVLYCLVGEDSAIA